MDRRPCSELLLFTAVAAAPLINGTVFKLPRVLFRTRSSPLLLSDKSVGPTSPDALICRGSAAEGSAGLGRETAEFCCCCCRFCFVITATRESRSWSTICWEEDTSAVSSFIFNVSKTLASAGSSI